jgi:hypothetical protein
MNAVELLMPDGKPTGVFVCGRCDHIYAPGSRRADVRGHYLKLANNCCTPTLCRTCGKPSGRQYYTLCEPCSRVEDAAKERALFDKAEKVEHDDGPFFTPGGRWFRDLDEIEDYYADADPEDGTKPEYVWCTKVLTDRPDWSGDALDKAHSDLSEDTADAIDRTALDELDAWCDAWWDANVPTCYEPDYKRCVVLADHLKPDPVVEG